MLFIASQVIAVYLIDGFLHLITFAPFEYLCTHQTHHRRVACQAGGTILREVLGPSERVKLNTADDRSFYSVCVGYTYDTPATPTTPATHPTTPTTLTAGPEAGVSCGRRLLLTTHTAVS